MHCVQPVLPVLRNAPARTPVPMPLLTEVIRSDGGLYYKHGAPNGAWPLVLPVLVVLVVLPFLPFLSFLPVLCVLPFLPVLFWELVLWLLWVLGRVGAVPSKKGV